MDPQEIRLAEETEASPLNAQSPLTCGYHIVEWRNHNDFEALIVDCHTIHAGDSDASSAAYVFQALTRKLGPGDHLVVLRLP
jgi:hypothetical protein